MDELSAAAETAAPEVVTPETAAQTETEAPEAEVDGEGGEDGKQGLSDSQKRRLARKQQVETIRQEREAALRAAEEAEQRRLRIVRAGESDKAPTEAEYPDPMEYVAAKAVWAASQRMTQREAENAKAAEDEAKGRVSQLEQAERAAVAASYSAQVQEAKSRYADFDAVVTQNAGLSVVDDQMAMMIASSEVGADLAYFLGSNIGVTQQIARMNPVDRARALGRIEATLSMPKPRTSTTAPPPVSPVRGGASAARDPAKMSYLEFKAYRESGGKIR